MQVRLLLLTASVGVVCGFHVVSPRFTSPVVSGRAISICGTLDTPSCHTWNRALSTTGLRASTGADLVAKREKRIFAEYLVSSVALLFLPGFFLFSNLFRTPIDLIYGAAGPIMASTVAYILGGAARHHRLGSDTYKRLNLSLAYFSLCSTAGFACVASRKLLPIGLPYIVSLKPSLKGWRYGVKGVDKGGDASLTEELIKGAKSTLVGVTNAQNINAFGYLAATLLVAGLKTIKLLDLVKVIRDGEPGRVIAGRLFRYGKLSLLSGVLYSLKDAADRNRLGGTTFVQLNFLSSFVLGSLAGYLFQHGEITRLGISVAFFSLFMVFNGVVSVMKKQQAS